MIKFEGKVLTFIFKRLYVFLQKKMKLFYTLLIIIFCSFSINSQDKNDIAKIYYNKALKSYSEKKIVKASAYLEKAIKYYEVVKNEEILIFGAKLYFETQDYYNAKEYFKAFFLLDKDKKSKNYNEMLLLYTDTLDAIESSSDNSSIEDKNTVEKAVIKSVSEEKIVEVEELEKEEEVNFAIIEEVPVFPGCRGSKSALKMCFSKKIQMHFVQNFDLDLPNQLGLPAGRKKVFIGFKIDNKGNVVNINARAPHPKLKEEVVRVMQLLPVMKPGMQRGKPIGVKYAIPFTLIVEGNKDPDTKKKN